MASASPPRGGEAKAALLAAPVNPSDLRTRTVGGGRTALYLTGETVIRCVRAASAEAPAQVRGTCLRRPAQQGKRAAGVRRVE